MTPLAIHAVNFIVFATGAAWLACGLFTVYGMIGHFLGWWPENNEGE